MRERMIKVILTGWALFVVIIIIGTVCTLVHFIGKYW